MEEELEILKELLQHADGLFEADLLEISQQNWQFVVIEYTNFRYNLIKHFGVKQFSENFVAEALAERV